MEVSFVVEDISCQAVRARLDWRPHRLLLTRCRLLLRSTLALVEVAPNGGIGAAVDALLDSFGVISFARCFLRPVAVASVLGGFAVVLAGEAAPRWAPSGQCRGCRSSRRLSLAPVATWKALLGRPAVMQFAADDGAAPPGRERLASRAGARSACGAALCSAVAAAPPAAAPPAAALLWVLVADAGVAFCGGKDDVTVHIADVQVKVVRLVVTGQRRGGGS